jgi:hypothetical protein
MPSPTATPLLCLALSALLVSTPLAAQDTGSGTTGGTAAAGQERGQTVQKPGETPASKEPQPEPYTDAEFAPWLHDLRRGEIVAIGSFPIVYLFAQLGYNLYRYGMHGGDAQYAPLGNPDQVPYSESETVGVILGAAALSVGVAVADYLIGQARERRKAAGAGGAKP